MNLRPLPDRKISILFSLLAIIGGGIVIFTFVGDTPTNLVCTGKFDNFRDTSASMQLRAILHYATTKTTPQQSLNEISISFNVLKSISPCNFLVFGLGHDSLMWASFNPGGPTLFLEEDPKWVNIVLKDAPDLNAVHVKYRTQLKEADDLLNSYKSEPECAPTKSYIRGNDKCKLALTGLPDVVYDKEWDMIMIDAPKGYYPEAPGRMGAIYSAAVMARNRKKSGVTHVFLHDVDRKVEKAFAEEFLCRNRKKSGVTHVFLHDVDRKVEKAFAEEFLCRKNLKDATGRLWHFEIPAAGANGTDSGSFC